MLLTATLLVLVLTATPARADCDALDPLCVVEAVEETTDPVVEVVDEVVDTVDDAIDEVVETVDEVVDTVEDTTDEAVDAVDDTVDTVTDPVEDAIDPVAPDPGVDPVAPVPPGASDPPADGEDPAPGTDSTVVRPDASVDPDAVSGSDPVLGPAPLDPVVLAGDVATASPQDLLGPFAGPLTDLAKRLAFPLALIVLVLAFVAVQNRLDRKDPKLALATTAPDVLSFT
jgi:hypothetical protein